jgi:hypothetical protein
MQVLEFGMGEAEVSEFSQLFQVWAAGFMPPAIELPFTPLGRGMAARCGARRRSPGCAAAARASIVVAAL